MNYTTKKKFVTYIISFHKQVAIGMVMMFCLPNLDFILNVEKKSCDNIFSEEVVIFFSSTVLSFFVKKKEPFISEKRKILEENTENSIFCDLFPGLIKYRISYSKMYKFNKILLCKQGNLANSNFGLESQSGSIFSRLPSESQK